MGPRTIRYLLLSLCLKRITLYSMPNLAPPLVTVSDDNPLDRVRFRLWQIGLTATTIGITVWFFTLGPIPGILAAVVAKHVLVAILAAGLRLNAPKITPPAPPL